MRRVVVPDPRRDLLGVPHYDKDRGGEPASLPSSAGETARLGTVFVLSASVEMERGLLE
jgi:hypothetical protein